MPLLTLEIKSIGPFQMRWHPYFSIVGMLVLMFIIPHDPSTSLDPHRVGSAAFRVSPRALRVRAPTSETTLSPQPQTPRHPTPAAAASASVFLGDQHQHAYGELLRLLRLTRARPQLVLRIFVDALCAPSSPSAPAFAVDLNSTQTLPWSTTVEGLRSAYGERQRWWGDLTPAETRALYHALLPTSLLNDQTGCSLAERAELAIAARRAARLYARERALLPFALGSELLDGVRSLLQGSGFRTQGMSDEQIWHKYAGCLPSDLPDGAAFADDIYLTILQKACSSNKHVDALCGHCADVAAAAHEVVSA